MVDRRINSQVSILDPLSQGTSTPYLSLARASAYRTKSSNFLRRSSHSAYFSGGLLRIVFLGASTGLGDTSTALLDDKGASEGFNMFI